MSDIKTGNFVCIEQTPASIGDRIFGRIIDIILLVVYNYSAATFVSKLPLDSDDMLRLLLILALLFLPAIGYTFLAELLFNGQTIGKYVMKTRVVMADGSSPTVGALFLRYVCEMVDLWMGFVGIIFIMCTKRHQRLGDLAAGTMVVKTEDTEHMRISIHEFDYARRGYTPTYANATRLTPRQADILRRAVADDSKTDERRIDALAEKVAHLLSLDDESWRYDGRTFLQTVLNDYMYLTQIDQ